MTAKTLEKARIIETVAPKANGKDMHFATNDWASAENVVPQFYAPSWWNPYNIDYGKSTYQIERIIFFEVGGGERFATKGWFTTTGISNNPYKRMALLDDGEPVHIKRKGGGAESHFKQDEPFIQSRGRDYSKQLKADLYIPMSYLDAMGWSLVERVIESGYQTSTQTIVEVAPSATQDKRPLFEMFHTLKTEKHFDTTKAALIQTLQNAESKEDIERVMSEFKYKF